MTKIYIAGPMRGIENFNRDQFEYAEHLLLGLGYEVFNPAGNSQENGIDLTSPTGNLDDVDLTKEELGEIIGGDIDELLTCDVILILDGSSQSKGATAEKAIAEWADIEVMYMEEVEIAIEIAGPLTEQVKATLLDRGQERKMEALFQESVPTGPCFFGFDASISQTLRTAEDMEIESAEMKAADGVKYDSGKPDWSLLDMSLIEDVVRVLTFGATKYAPDNWKKVPDAKERYFSAAMRHMTAYMGGEGEDPETGLSHLAHAQCCLHFMQWFEYEEEISLGFGEEHY